MELAGKRETRLPGQLSRQLEVVLEVTRFGVLSVGPFL